MFVPCPHCGFLVALIVGRGDTTQSCPRCGKALDTPVVAADAMDPAKADVGDTQETTPVRTAASPQAGPASDAPPPSPSSAHPTGQGAGPDRGATKPGAHIQSAVGGEASTELSPPAGRSTAKVSHPRAGHRRPTFARTVGMPARPHGPRWPWVVSFGLLAALLILQLLLLQRAELAASARWRPVIASVCAALGCEVPLWHQPAAYTMLARDVRPASDESGVLQVSASFRNDAPLPQAWPVLYLQLTDVNGQAVAARMLQPTEYHSDTAHEAALASGQSASVSFRIAEPATPIVAFNFDFR